MILLFLFFTVPSFFFYVFIIRSVLPACRVHYTTAGPETKIQNSLRCFYTAWITRLADRATGVANRMAGTLRCRQISNAFILGPDAMFRTFFPVIYALFK